MQVIVFSSRLGRPRQFKLNGKHLLGVFSLGVLAVFLGAYLMYWFTQNHLERFNLPWITKMIQTAKAEEARKNEEFIKQNINAMAKRLGEMQAQVMRLEAVSDRVSTLAGGRVDARPADKPAAPAINMGVGSGLRTPGAAPAPGGANLGRGGPAPAYSAELTVSDFQRELDKLTRTMESRFDQLQAAEAQMLWTKIAAKRMPTLQPVNVGYNISSFGWRIDPINGRGSMHEGIDFVAPEGTAVFAAADGIVIAAENHHSYGQMLEVDHGSDLITRYAHNSKHLVAVGALVKRGQKIAEVGNTGRSTGSHLHFEVRIKGTAIDPSKFLQAGSNQTPASQQAAAATVQKLAAEVRANSAANGAPGSTTAAGK